MLYNLTSLYFAQRFTHSTYVIHEIQAIIESKFERDWTKRIEANKDEKEM